ncbi:IclR family transcriptional regulator [Pseudohalocynthiibacter aestuariivivens]|uniref:IclR family transcriptional regulator n=1 Tax=Roseovarius pelagicus TaxID=2980108 RepID=A0ABY6D6M6_9RHOB|nr:MULTISPECIES: IclR family transcriptional regulator [Rhodobacterales]QIE46237.1 IclR family transcriptional regulator [Pseudohalocynthiibacter aestuariivivens]UXX81796.1 IclR family transcriptional regulator [Roseovarius pelagicus]
MTEASEKEGTIPTNLRLLMVLEELARAGVPVTPTEVNQTLGLPKPTIHRLFGTLEKEGFIQREIDGRGYAPGGRLRRLSTDVLSSLRIRTARIAILTRLAQAVGETCNIALPDREGMIYLERVESKWPLRIQLPVGTMVPFYCTASGKMYLSQLDEKHLRNYATTGALEARTNATITHPDALLDEVRAIRKRGYATDNAEFMDGMIAVAVPIVETNGRLVSTLSFHAPAQRLSLSDAIAFVPQLQDAAQKLSNLIDDGDAVE